MALDENDLKQIQAMLATALGGEEMAKSVGRVVTTQIGSALKTLDIDKKIAEGIKSAVPEKPATDHGADADAAGAKDKAPDARDIEVKKLETKYSEILARAEREAKRAEEAERARKEAADLAALRDALTAGGADPKRVQIAISHIIATKQLKTNSDGAPGFEVPTAWGTPEFVPVEAGAATWLKTDEGKFFLPPQGGGGTGDKTGAPAKNAAGTTTSAMSILGPALAGIHR
ncbi:MAG: hypothetical protein ABL912_01810 [Novosphingobium sp.]